MSRGSPIRCESLILLPRAVITRHPRGVRASRPPVRARCPHSPVTHLPLRAITARIMPSRTRPMEDPGEASPRPRSMICRRSWDDMRCRSFGMDSPLRRLPEAEMRIEVERGLRQRPESPGVYRPLWLRTHQDDDFRRFRRRARFGVSDHGWGRVNGKGRFDFRSKRLECV